MKLKKILAEKQDGGKICTISGDANLHEVAVQLCKHRIGALLVTETDKDGKETHVGIISERDVIREICNNSDMHAVKVADVMTRDVIVATPDDDVEDVMAIMTSHYIRHLPIIDETEIVGIISVGDVIESMHQEAQIKIHYLRDYVGGTYGNRVY